MKIKGKYGDSCTFFTYCDYEIIKGRKEIPGIPFAQAAEDTETLKIRMLDEVKGCYLTLYYTVYPSHDLITRYFTIDNQGQDPVKLQKAMSICLDLPGHEYDVITLYGCQTAERNVQRRSVGYGNYSIGSRRGASSHDFNPFLALASPDTNEESGDVYAFNLVYSGSFLDEVEVDAQGNTRVGIGLGEENFAYTIEAGSYLQNEPYQRREMSWYMELPPLKVYTLRIRAADAEAIYQEKITGQMYAGIDLQRGIQIRIAKEAEYGSVMLFEKQL